VLNGDLHPHLRVLGPPIQVAGVENTIGGVNRERRAADNNLKSVVIEAQRTMSLIAADLPGYQPVTSLPLPT